MGINDYKAAKPAPTARAPGRLKEAVNDAEALRGALEEQKLYGATDMTLLLIGKEATRQAILDALDDLAENAGPDDQCIIFLSGHGDYRVESRRTAAPQSVFVFCPPDYDPTKPYRRGSPTKLLFDKLAAIPCRKLLILDACRSGGRGRRQPGARVRPGRPGADRPGGLRPQPGVARTPMFGHGLFTCASWRPWTSGALPRPRRRQELYVNELFRYTRRRCRSC